MARPVDRAEQKTETLHFRVTPALKAKLEAEAKLGGRKLSAECENRLWASMEESERPQSTPETQALLREIEGSIAAIEAGGKSNWHKSVSTWAAVWEMLKSGPIIARAPSSMSQKDERLREIFERLREVDTEQEVIRKSLQMVQVNALLVYATPDLIAEAVEGLDLPEKIKASAMEEIGRLHDLEAEAARLQAEVDEIVEPYVEPAKEGRTFYAKPIPSLLVAIVIGRLDPRPSALAPFMVNSPPPLPSLRPRAGMFGSSPPSEKAR